MIITNKKEIKIPNFIMIDGNKIKVVNEFELLGVVIDSKLNFNKHVCEVRKAINKRLYSIKRLFFLTMSVKIQFFKTFILPHFDYCATISIYLPKSSIQKLANTYNNCIFNLFNTKETRDFKILDNKDYNK